MERDDDEREKSVLSAASTLYRKALHELRGRDKPLSSAQNYMFQIGANLYRTNERGTYQLAPFLRRIAFESWLNGIKDDGHDVEIDNDEINHSLLALVRKAKRDIKGGSFIVRELVSEVSMNDDPAVQEWCGTETNNDFIFGGDGMRLVVKLEDARGWMERGGMPIPAWLGQDRVCDSEVDEVLRSFYGHNSQIKTLVDAYDHWWNGFDQEVDSAPTKEQITAWLMKNHAISCRTAEYMAAILRDPSVPPGPRKKRK